nr:MAG TPA: hypothetical protein [Crassvirales sp.]
MDVKELSKNYGKIVFYFLLLVIDIWLIDTSLGFINSPSDIGVIVGTCLLIMSIGILLVWGYSIVVKFINFINKLV